MDCHGDDDGDLASFGAKPPGRRRSPCGGVRVTTNVPVGSGHQCQPSLVADTFDVRAQDWVRQGDLHLSCCR